MAVVSTKPAVSPKRGKIGPHMTNMSGNCLVNKLSLSLSVLLMTNTKLHTRFRLVPKSVTLDDLERPLRSPLHRTCVFRSLQRKFEDKIHTIGGEDVAQ